MLQYFSYYAFSMYSREGKSINPRGCAPRSQDQLVNCLVAIYDVCLEYHTVTHMHMHVPSQPNTYTLTHTHSHTRTDPTHKANIGSDKMKMIVKKLCNKDPHQFFQRLETLARSVPFLIPILLTPSREGASLSSISNPKRKGQPSQLPTQANFNPSIRQSHLHNVHVHVGAYSLQKWYMYMYNMLQVC